jgi:hypothetical protein
LWSRFSSLRKLLVGCEQGVPGVHFGAGAVHGDGMIDGEVIEILCGNTIEYTYTAVLLLVLRTSKCNLD